MSIEKNYQYLKLLEALAKICFVVKSKHFTYREKERDAEGLITKFYSHCASAFYLSKSTIIKELNTSFFDFPSINILCRSVIEAFLVFNYVFETSKTKEESYFKYIAWVRAGLFDRKSYTPLSPQGKKRLEEDKRLIDKYEEELRNNKYFKALSEKEKNW